ncbi:MAG: sulfite exporter TauE/SafE family protein [Proteobacteria bacterium]|nr:sulfite exporter TauE/SafE family protein [Pseudomonadota bacterium]
MENAGIAPGGSQFRPERLAEMAEIALCSLILILGGFTFSFAGFGFALVTLPLIALFIPVKTAVPFLFPFAGGLVIYNTWRYGRLADWRRLQPLMFGACLALPAGMLSLTLFPESLLKKFLALFIVFGVLAPKINPRSDRTRGRLFFWSWGLLCGLLSGWFQGAYTTGGPPAVLYIMSLTSNPRAAKGLLATYFTLLMVVTALLYGAGGLFSWEWMLKSAAYIPAVVFGTIMGTAISNRVSAERYRMGVDLLLILSASLLWLRG